MFANPITVPDACELLNDMKINQINFMSASLNESGLKVLKLWLKDCALTKKRKDADFIADCVVKMESDAIKHLQRSGYASLTLLSHETRLGDEETLYLRVEFEFDWFMHDEPRRISAEDSKMLFVMRNKRG